MDNLPNTPLFVDVSKSPFVTPVSPLVFVIIFLFSTLDILELSTDNSYVLATPPKNSPLPMSLEHVTFPVTTTFPDVSSEVTPFVNVMNLFVDEPDVVTS